jgi:hypothetical protein
VKDDPNTYHLYQPGIYNISLYLKSDNTRMVEF